VGGLVWKALSLSTTLLATKVATNVASKGWKLATGRPVPVKGDYEREKTRDVVAYTALSAMILAGTKVAAERKAAQYYRQSTGHLPKALASAKPTKQEKKAAKKLEKATKRVKKSATKLAP
jgi:hypothetical protein